MDERFGKRKDLQGLIDAAHQRGIAVLLDAVYGHTSDNFPYSYLYKKLAYYENPFMGPFARDYFGDSTDFRRAFTRDFFLTVNHHWLDCYHVDGFRYDYVLNNWNDRRRSWKRPIVTAPGRTRRWALQKGWYTGIRIN